MDLTLFLLLCLIFATRSYGKDLARRQTSSVSGHSERKCGSSMCVSATINASAVEYVLSSTGKQPLGWMGIGFGQWMANSPMVIMWANADGSVTLSQRTAPREIMPTVDPSPPRIATLSDVLTSVSNSTSSFGFTIPVDTDSSSHHTLIYAYATTVPISSDVDAHLAMHREHGVMQFDLANDSPMSTSSVSSTSSSSSPSPTSTLHHALPVYDAPLPHYQRYIVVHAVFCALGFLIVLPAGVLSARYLRTFTDTWFQSHWILQFAIAGPFISIGSLFGIFAVSKAGAYHLNDPHKLWGAALLVLYAIQLSLGAIIHWIKPKGGRGRPPQNYAHAVAGILIIGLALFQVRSGYKVEWPKATGLAVPGFVNVMFWTLVLLLPGSYAFGMVFLPKQLRREKSRRAKAVINDDEIPLNTEMTDLQESEYKDSDWVDTSASRS